MLEIELFNARKSALVTLAFLSFVYFLENFDRYLIAVSPIPYIDYSSYEYSILAGPAFTIVYTFGGLLFSLKFSDGRMLGNMKWSKFLILSFATLIFSLAFSLTAVATVFWQQVLIRIVMGVSQSIITPFSTSIISDNFAPVVRGSAFSIFNVGTYIAFSLSLSLGTYIYLEYGWKAGYLIFGILGIVCSLFLPVLDCFNRNQLPYLSLAENDVKSTTPVTNESADNVDGSVATDERTGEAATEVPDKHSISKIWLTVKEIIQVHWRKQQVVYLICVATGIRLGAGYIWTAYTSVFFSSLLVQQDSTSTCHYSAVNSTSVASGWTSGSGTCSTDYPYCVDEACYKVAKYPWHNVGMDPQRLEEFMAWVPLMGSALGSVLGGFLSDYLVKRRNDENKLQATVPSPHLERNSRDDPAASPQLSPTRNPMRGTSSKDLFSHSLSLLDEEHAAQRKHSLDLSSDCTDGPADDRAPKSISKHSPRMLICGIGNLLAVPLVVCALLLDFPYCFLILIASGMVAELYLSQTLAIVTDSSLIPPRLVTQSVALFMFIITFIGGNVPVFVPLLESLVGYTGKVVVHFDAANSFIVATATGVEESTYYVENSDAKQLQYSMIYILIFCYGTSGLLYLICYFTMRQLNIKSERVEL